MRIVRGTYRYCIKYCSLYLNYILRYIIEKIKKKGFFAQQKGAFHKDL